MSVTTVLLSFCQYRIVAEAEAGQKDTREIPQQCGGHKQAKVILSRTYSHGRQIASCADGFLMMIPVEKKARAKEGVG